MTLDGNEILDLVFLNVTFFLITWPYIADVFSFMLLFFNSLNQNKPSGAHTDYGIP